MHTKILVRVGLLAGLFLVRLPVPAHAQVPLLINYQGRLVDGTNLVNQVVSLEFALYDDATHGVALYVDKDPGGVAVVDGLYSAYLGDHTVSGDLDLALTNQQVWLEVVVDGTPLTPRERLASVPYARHLHGFLRDDAGNILVNSLGTNFIGRPGAFSVVGGGAVNWIGSNASYSVIAGGAANYIENNASASVMAGGVGHWISATASNSAIGGGLFNSIQSPFGVIPGGYANEIGPRGFNSVIAGGAENVIFSNVFNSAIGGGSRNRIINGTTNAVIGGGFANMISNRANYSVISGGRSNVIHIMAEESVIGGGRQNVIRDLSDVSVIGGGSRNVIGEDSRGSLVAGGSVNVIGTNVANSAIGGGLNNRIGRYAYGSTIGGGKSNTIFGGESLFIGWTTIDSATIAGGDENFIGQVSHYATIAGGRRNRIGNEAEYATILGGFNNTASNRFAVAFGRGARANHSGTLVWGDNSTSLVASAFANSVTMRASGGYRFITTSNVIAGAQLPAGATSWSAISDRNAKENFTPINTADILEEVAALPLTAWTYKHDPDQRRYIGPVAQDFHAAFGLGDDTTINTLDTDGVALAAIQGLTAEVREGASEFGVRIAELEAENARLREELNAIKRKLGM